MASAHSLLPMLIGMALFLPAWAGDQITTSEQAITRAQLFLKDVGWNTTAKPVATFPAPHGFSTAWSVEYPLRGEFNETISLRIDRATGQVQSALNLGALQQLPEGNKVTITKERANTASEQVLTKAGISMESLRLYQSQPICETSPPRDQQWTVRYYRVHAGYQFQSDSVVVSLHPLNASLISFRASLQSPTPKSVKVTLKESDAKTAAEKYLTEKGRAIQRIDSAVLMIVLPNHYYEKQQPTSIEAATRLAWVIRCIRKNEPLKRPDGTVFTPNDEHFDDVWVDAETGKILGGVACK